MFASPLPWLGFTNPTPSSIITNSTILGPASIVMLTLTAPECLTTLLSPSVTTDTRLFGHSLVHVVERPCKVDPWVKDGVGTHGGDGAQDPLAQSFRGPA